MEKIKTEWDLSPLLEGDDDPKQEEDLKRVEESVKKFVSKWKDREDYLDKPEVLKEALGDYEELMREYSTFGDPGYYFWLRTQQDQINSKIKAKYNKIDEKSKKLSNELLFFELKIAKIDKSRQKDFLEFKGLKDYNHYLEKIFAKGKHMLSEAEEKIVSLKSTTAHDNWVKMVSDFLSRKEREVLTPEGKRENKSFESILKFSFDRNKKVRDEAAEKVNEIIAEVVDSAEAEINSVFLNKKVDDELRAFNRPDSSRHLNDDIETEVVDALVDSVTKRYDISRKFYELKSKLLGVKKLKYHERNVPYGEIDKKYSYGEAINLIQRTFDNLDKEFGQIFEKLNEKGQVDVYPKKGKRGGAFCAYQLLTQPTYILLNYVGNLDDITTIAHEFGHAINDELMRKQNSLNFGTTMSTAEVASTFMEDFVLEELLKNADDELRLVLMVQKMDDFVKTIIRQIACYRFEQELHKEFREKSYLSKEEIGKIFQRNMMAYMGDYIEQGDGSESYWVHWWHIREFFYVYSYASGLLISKALQGKVRKDRKFIEKVKEFLSAGTSDSPKNLFMKMGIDITKKEFWDLGLDEIEKLLEETEKLAKKLGKI